MEMLAGLHALFIRPPLLEWFIPAVAGCAIAGILLFLLEIRSGRVRGISAWWSACRWVALLPIFGGTLVIALAGPQDIVSDILKEKLRGKILIAVDDSASSGASDIPERLKRQLRTTIHRFPTRLSLCTASLEEGLRDIQGISFALVTFTEAVNFRTGDWIDSFEKQKPQLASILSSLRPLWVGSGTNLGRMFLEVKLEFGDEPDLMLLCSDGGMGGTTDSKEFLLKNIEAFSGQTTKKIPVYTFGVGGRGIGAQPIPVFGPEGEILEHAQDPASGQAAMTQFDERILIEIARLGGGSYTYVDDISKVREVLRRAVYDAAKKGTIKVESARDADRGYILASAISFLLATNGAAWLLWPLIGRNGNGRKKTR